MISAVKPDEPASNIQQRDNALFAVQSVRVIAALLAFAAIAGAMALGVALIALYQWTAEEAGVYAGLGAAGAGGLGCLRSR
jgi:hypothetical protein